MFFPESFHIPKRYKKKNMIEKLHSRARVLGAHHHRGPKNEEIVRRGETRELLLFVEDEAPRSRIGTC